MLNVEQPTFASRFRAALAAKPEMTKYRLAQLSGVNESQIGKIEKGKSLPGEETLVKLAPHIGVSLADLVSWAAEERLLSVLTKDPGFRTDLIEAVAEDARRKIAERLRQISELEASIGQLEQIQGVFESRGEVDTEPAKLIAEAKVHAEAALKTARTYLARLENRVVEDSREEATTPPQPEAEPPVGADLRDKATPIRRGRSDWAVPKRLKLEDDEKELMRQLQPSDLLELGPAYVEEFWKRPKASRMETFREWVADNAETGHQDARKEA